jgi:hypothetical protein
VQPVAVLPLGRGGTVPAADGGRGTDLENATIEIELRVWPGSQVPQPGDTILANHEVDKPVRRPTAPATDRRVDESTCRQVAAAVTAW